MQARPPMEGGYCGRTREELAGMDPRTKAAHEQYVRERDKRRDQEQEERRVAEYGASWHFCCTWLSMGSRFITSTHLQPAGGQP